MKHFIDVHGRKLLAGQTVSQNGKTIFGKRVKKNTHFLKVRNSWCFDSKLFDSVISGCDEIWLKVDDTNKFIGIKVSIAKQHLVTIDYEHGKQYAISEKYFTEGDEKKVVVQNEIKNENDDDVDSGPEELLELCRNSKRKGAVEWRTLENECLMIYNLGLKEYYLYMLKQKIKVKNDRNSWLAYVIGISDDKPKGKWKESRAVKGTLPDIDMDFQDDRRNELKDYLAEKWGKNKVASLCVFSHMKGKSSLHDVARCYDIPIAETMKATSNIVNRSSGDARASQTLPDAFNEFQECKEFQANHPEVVAHAIRLEGQNRHVGTHAAGVIISSDPIVNNCPLIKVHDDIVTGYESHDLELLGYTKFDILGLNTLTIIQRTIEMLKKRRNIKIDIDSLSLDDEKVYAEFAKGNTRTVFQFESEGCKRMSRMLHIDNFDELIAANALNRPGPLRSGLVPLYCTGKKEQKVVKSLHPLLDELLKETYGVFLFQEQVMLVLYRLGNFDWTSISKIRHIISKSVGVETINQYRDRFIIGAKKKGINESTANAIYNQIGEFGSYGFNKSHSAAYALIAFQTMWLKVYYPMEYMTVVLTMTKDREKMIIYLDELRRMKVKLMPPNVNISETNFSTDGKAIYYGLAHVKGVGQKAADEIMKKQPYKDFNNFLKKVELRPVNSRVIKALAQIDAFSDLKCNSKEIFLKCDDILKTFKKNLPFHIPKSNTWKQSELLQTRYEMLGLPMSDKHPSELHRGFLKTLSVRKRIIGTEQFFKAKMFGQVLLYGMILKCFFTKIGDFREAFGKPGEAYMRLSLDDGWEDFIFVIIPPWVYNLRKGLLKMGAPIIVEGQKRGDGRMFASDVCSVLELEKAKKENTVNLLNRYEKKLIQHPVIGYRELMRKKGHELGKSIDEWRLVDCLKNYQSGYLSVANISKVKIHETKRGQMSFLTLDDEVGCREAVIFSTVWSKYKDTLTKNSIITFRAELGSRDSIVFGDKAKIKLLKKGDEVSSEQ